MLIHLSELFTREGKREVYIVRFGLSSVAFGSDLYEVVQAEPFELVFTGLGGRKCSMKGDSSLVLRTPCARCLEPVTFSCELHFDQELTPDQDGAAQDADQEKEPYLNGCELDVDQLVCNELILSLPMRVLCREDCKGICNRCGTNLNLRTCTCDTGPFDPRMSVFQEIFNEMKEV